MASPIQLTGLDILLTYECTGRCAHCCYRAGPGQDCTMTRAEVENYMAAVASYSLNWILLFGGEPFLCYDLLRAAVASAAPIASVLVFTNGYWATGPATARSLLAGLQEAGLDHILFSVDAFHQAHVPLDRIAVGIEAARALGFGRVEIDNCFLDGREVDHALNRRTLENVARLAQLCDLDGVGVGQSTARMVGRAADRLPAVFPGRNDGTARHTSISECSLPSYLGDDIRAPTAVEIHPGGWVNLCAGVALGNVRDRPLKDILEGHDPNAQPVISTLAREGPAGLLELAQSHGYSSSGDYLDGCHLCYQVRRFLRPYYPDQLAPGHVYKQRT